MPCALAVTKPVCFNPSALLCCSKSTSSCIKFLFQGFHIFIMIVPQFFSMTSKNLLYRWEGVKIKGKYLSLCPTDWVSGLSISMGTGEAPGTALFQTHNLAVNFQGKLVKLFSQTVLSACMTYHLHSRGCSIKSECCGLTEQGGICTVLEMGYFSVNESGLVTKYTRAENVWQALQLCYAAEMSKTRQILKPSGHLASSLFGPRMATETLFLAPGLPSF